MSNRAILTIIVRGGTVPSIFLVIIASAGADLPLTIGEWVNFALWRMETSGLIDPIFASSRPFEREEIAQAVANMRKRIEDGHLKPDSLELSLINKLEAEFSRDLRPEGLEMRGSLAGELDYWYYDAPDHLPYKWDSPEASSVSLWGAASFHPTPNMTLYEEIDVGRGREIVGDEGDTASRRTRTWNWDYTADFQKAYMSFRWERFDALLGRQSLFWGPGYGGSLILSDSSPAFDMVLLKARFGSVKAMAFSAVLDKMWSEHGNPPYRYLANRYLSGHRIDWIVNDRIELGLSELVLYGGEARSMEFQYVNPLIPYYASQWNADQDDNVLVSADFAIRYFDRLKLYGQFLVDDFSYSGDDPNMLGYMAGLYVSDPLGLSGTDMRAEYTRIDTHTYAHRIVENQFTHYGWVMGHHLGPDADQLLMELSRMINVDVRLKLSYTFERQGVHTVSTFRSEDYEQMEFPSEPVERQHKIGLQFLWEPLRGPQVSLSWRRFFIRQQDSTSGEAPRKAELSVIARYLFDSHFLAKGAKELWR